MPDVLDFQNFQKKLLVPAISKVPVLCFFYRVRFFKRFGVFG